MRRIANRSTGGLPRGWANRGGGNTSRAARAGGGSSGNS